MNECGKVREKYLDEYIADLDIEPNVKKRMLDLYHSEDKKHAQLSECLHHCHKRIDELEQAVVELSIDLATAKRFIREQMK